MVVKEFYMTRADGVNLYRHYSDAGKMLKQNETGIEYAEAIDVENAPFTYSESANDVAHKPNTYTAEQLEAMTNAELSAILAEMGISGSMTKANMIALILDKQNTLA